jgi:hypothetical protein
VAAILPRHAVDGAGVHAQLAVGPRAFQAGKSTGDARVELAEAACGRSREKCGAGRQRWGCHRLDAILRCARLITHGDFAQSNDLARLEPALLDQFAIDECAGGGAEVFDPDAGVANGDAAVRTRDGRVFEGNIVFFASAEREGARLKVDGPGLRRIRIDQKAAHSQFLMGGQ